MATQKTVQDIILDFLNNNTPWFMPIFSYLKGQVSSATPLGIATYMIYSNSPLPSPPVELYVLFAYTEGASILGITGIGIGITTIFVTLYYIIGYIFGKGIIEKITRKPFRYSKLLDRLSVIIVFITYLLPIPLPSTIIMLTFGAYRTSFRKLIVAVAIATAVRFLTVIFLYKYYGPLIEGYVPLTSYLKSFKLF